MSYICTILFNMQLLLLASTLVAIVTSDVSQNKYLPPISANRGNIFTAPVTGQNFGHATPTLQGSGVAGFFPSVPLGSKVSHASRQIAEGPIKYGAPHAKSAEAYSKILRFDNDNDGLGHYSYAYETENHIRAQATGNLENPGTDAEASSVHGDYSWFGPDGVEYSVTYIADKDGYRAVGAHLPTPPPIPEAILRSLEKNAAEEAAGGHGYNPNTGYPSGDEHSVSINKQYIAPSQPSYSSKDGYRY